jgi:hypothetical protein
MMLNKLLQSPTPQDNCTGHDAVEIASELSYRFSVPTKQIYVLDAQGQKCAMADVCTALGISPDEDTPMALNFCASWRFHEGQMFDVNLAQAARLNGILTENARRRGESMPCSECVNDAV